MSKLSNRLKELLNETDKSVYCFSAQTNIERTYLTKILSGQRAITLDKFLAIVNALSLDSTHRHELVEMYLDESFSKTKYQTYCDCLSYSFFAPPGLSSPVTGIDGDFIPFDNKYRLFDFAVFFLSPENPTERLYTNFPTATLLTMAQQRTDCDFRCIVHSDDKENPVTVFDLIKLNLLCCVSYTAKTSADKKRNDFFPYVIVSDDGILFSNKRFDSGYYIKNKTLADIYAKEFCKLTHTMNVGTHIHNDILDVKELMRNNMFSKKIHRVLSSNFCAITFMTREEFSELAREELPNREYLIDTTYEYYRSFFDSSDMHRFVTNLDGLTSFCETGIIGEMPLSYSRPLSVQTRINILKRIIEALEAENAKFTIGFVKTSGVDRFEINIDAESGISKENEKASSLIVMSADKARENYFPGNRLFLSTEENANNDFNDFFDLFSVSQYVTNKKESIEILKDRMLRLVYSAKSAN